MGKNAEKQNEVKTVALVANTSWSIYNFRLGLIRQLIKLGMRVVIISPKDLYSDRLVAEGCDYKSIYMDNRGTNPLNDFRTLRQLICIYKTTNIDFIFHYTVKPNIYGSIAAGVAGIRPHRQGPEQHAP